MSFFGGLCVGQDRQRTNGDASLLWDPSSRHALLLTGMCCCLRSNHVLWKDDVEVVLCLHQKMLKHEKQTVRNAVLVFCREEPTVIQWTTATQASGDAPPPGMSFMRRRTSCLAIILGRNWQSRYFSFRPTKTTLASCWCFSICCRTVDWQAQKDLASFVKSTKEIHFSWHDCAFSLVYM